MRMHKHKGAIFIVLCMAIGLATYAFAANVKIVVEAENCVSITPSMEKVSSTLASGGAFIQIPLQRPHGTQEGAPVDQGSAKYVVKIPVAGTYRFWGRAHWHDGCGNSFFLKIGDKPWVVFGQDGTYQRWHWVKGPTVELPAGNVEIIVRNREDGAKLDQFLLTTNLNYVPVRAEKPTP